MEYQKTNVNAFLGLESNQRPELIKNEEASDIENLRFEKLGYLVNRNGVQGHPLYMSKYMNIADINGVLWSIGTVGITEYTIEKPWGIGSGEEGMGAYDNFTLGVYSPTSQNQSKYTDRFMVYCVRIPASKAAVSSAKTDRNNEPNFSVSQSAYVDPENRYTWRYKAAYLLMPLTGPSGWRDTFAFAPNANKLSLSGINPGPNIPANGTNQLLSGKYYRISNGTVNLTAAPYAGNIDIKRVYGSNTAATSGTVFYVSSTFTLPVSAGVIFQEVELSYEPEDTTLPGLYATFGSRSILKPDDKPNKLQIYAPARWLGVHNKFHDAGVPKDLNWIEHYVTMQQYRESIVISDMTNKDMILVDEFMEAEYNEPRKHRFTLRENALAHFNVDDVVIDFGLGGSNFNQIGVEAPMALYKFYLPRNRFTATRDNYTPTYQGLSESPSYTQLYRDYDDKTKEFGYKWRCLKHDEIKVFLALEWWTGGDDGIGGDEYQGSSITCDNITRYTFSNQSEASEYDDLFGTLSLANPNITADDQTSSDVYIWEDLKIKYYPVSGVIQNQYFLTAKDRTWNKTNSSGTKIIKLENHSGFEQDVPLGVWRYRFVWYMGNGEYSAPSAELLVPDLLFSGLKDSEITSSLGTYIRPFGISSEDDALKTNIDFSSSAVRFINENSNAAGVRIFEQDANPAQLRLTAYGQNYLMIKKEILRPDHRFAAYDSSTGGTSWPGNWTAESLLAQGNLCVSATLYPGNDALVCAGVIAETATSQYGDIEKDDEKVNLLGAITTSELALNIPMFPSESSSVTYNSVFTTKGVIRTIYQNLPSNQGYQNTVPSYQIALSGTYRFGFTNTAETTDAYEQDGTINDDADNRISSAAATEGGQIYFNVVTPQTNYDPTSPPATAVDIDRNNEDDEDYYPTNTLIRRWSYRNMTQVRGVQDQADRISNLKSGIPAEVISRIILQGSAEINLCDYDDRGTLAFESTIYYPLLEFGTTNRTNRYLSRYVQPAPPAQASRIFWYPTQFSGAPSNDIWFGKAPKDALGFATSYNQTHYYSYANKSWMVAPIDRLGLDNLKVAVSMPGERLTISEQLSMYVPASLLFEAPHVKVVVPSNRIPRRARQLLIFRTRASHDNAWQPHDYGLVKSIDIIRDGATGLPTADHLEKVEFLDDVKSSELDYSYSLTDYDGFTSPISSRFNLPLNERMFYANIKESYRPHTPRSLVNVVAGDNVNNSTHKNLNISAQAELEKLWSYRLVSDNDPNLTLTNITKRYLYYFITYNDQARSNSLSSCSGLIDRGASFATTKNKPVFFCLPSAYDPAIEQINIYRLQLSDVGGIPKIELAWPTVSSGLIPAGQTYFVVQGAVEYNGQVYYTNDVIQTFDGNDVGYDGARVNRFRNYFNNSGAQDSDRGWGKSYSYPILYNITDYFDGATGGAGNDFVEKIGTIKPEAEGIFYDNDLPALGRLPIKQIFQNEDYSPAAVRWSEPYQPNKIKLASLMEVRSGDGDQITGLAMLYGNLIVLKERSMHRLAVQGSTVPVSRVDEISNNVGCIAPNTVITVNNTLYFLSWAGFYKYDNNQLSKLDGKFSEELQIRLRSSQDGVINPAIRDASCGWNPTYRELYLTIPVMSTSSNEGDYQSGNVMGITLTDNKGTREVRGTTYAINVDTGLATKYRYMDDSIYFTDPSLWQQQLYPPVASQRAPRVYSRLYYTSSLGQLRSGECLPPRTINYLLPYVPAGTDTTMEYLRVSHFIESPTKDGNNRDKATDDYLMFTQSLINPAIILIVQVSKFVRIFWSSKSWTMEDKSVLKRIRKVFAFISASDDPVILRGITHTSPEGETATSDTTWQYTYVDSRLTSPRQGYSVTGEILGIPAESAGQTASPSQNRGERYTFNIEGSGAFQMEYFGFYWKQINQYER